MTTTTSKEKMVLLSKTIVNAASVIQQLKKVMLTLPITIEGIKIGTDYSLEEIQDIVNTQISCRVTELNCIVIGRYSEFIIQMVNTKLPNNPTVDKKYGAWVPLKNLISGDTVLVNISGHKKDGSSFNGVIAETIIATNNSGKIMFVCNIDNAPYIGTAKYSNDHKQFVSTDVHHPVDNEIFIVKCFNIGRIKQIAF